MNETIVKTPTILCYKHCKYCEKKYMGEPKMKVDGITKYVQDVNFKFDNSFNENENS